MTDKTITESAIDIMAIVDNMGERRHELIEESIKEIDMKISETMSRFRDEVDLDKKLSIYKDKRALESTRAERRKRLFLFIDDGALYANSPLEMYELDALIKPLRSVMAGDL